MYSSTVQAMLARGNTVDTDVERTIPLIMPNGVKDTGGTDTNPPVEKNRVSLREKRSIMVNA